MLDAREFGQPLLEFAHLGAENPLAALDGCLDGAVEGLAEPAALGLKVDEGNRGCHKAYSGAETVSFYRAATAGTTRGPDTKCCRFRQPS